MSLRGINNVTAYDPWVVEQFQGFDGFPDSTGVDGNGAVVLIPGVAPAQPQNPLIIADPGAPYPPFYSVKPMGNGSEVFGYDAQGRVMPDACGVSVNGGDWGGVVGSGNSGGEIGPAVLPQLSPMPSATTATMPTVTGTANRVCGTNGQVGTTPPAITPQWLNQRLPSIVNPAPVDMGVPGCEGGVSGLIAGNPVLALGALAVLAYMVWGRK